MLLLAAALVILAFHFVASRISQLSSVAVPPPLRSPLRSPLHSPLLAASHAMRTAAAEEMHLQALSACSRSLLRSKHRTVVNFCAMLERLHASAGASSWLPCVSSGPGLTGMDAQLPPAPHRHTSKKQRPLVMDFLPVLHRGPLGPGVEHWMTDARWRDRYARERPIRDRAGSHAQFHRARAGAVTLPHEDYDLDDVAVGTVLALLEGAQVVLAWDETVEVGLLEALDATPRDAWDALLVPVARAGRLVVVHMRAGEVLVMRPRVAHMVVTTHDKVQFSFHLYDA